MSSEQERDEVDAGRLMGEYAEATRRLDALRDRAGEWAEQLERLAHGLNAHPRRLIIGLPDRFIENPGEWDIVPGHPLPSIETLTTLTNDIREATRTVEELRERLILMGRADVIEHPDGFFQ